MVTFKILDEEASCVVQTNGGRFQTEHKDINDLEAIVKKEIPATKQVRHHTYIHSIKFPKD
jgi:hypothetical protein